MVLLGGLVWVLVALLIAAPSAVGGDTIPPKFTFSLESVQSQGSENSVRSVRFFDKKPAAFVIGSTVDNETTGNQEISKSELEQSTMAIVCAVEDLNSVSESSVLGTTFYYNIIQNSDGQAGQAWGPINFAQIGVPAFLGPSNLSTSDSIEVFYATLNLTIVSGALVSRFSDGSTSSATILRTISLDDVQSNAIVKVMQHFNWSLVCVLYTPTLYGYSGYNSMIVATTLAGITQTCTMSIYEPSASSVLAARVCLESSQARVVLLWMSATDASATIAELYQSSALRELTFFAPDSWSDYADAEGFTGGAFPVSYLEGTVGVYPEGHSDKAFRECVQRRVMQGGDGRGPLEHLFRDYWQSTYGCSFGEGLPPCEKGDGAKRSKKSSATPCRCSVDEDLSLLHVWSKVNFVYDAVYSIYAGLLQINTNCTAISEVLDFDYCSAETITSSQLQRVIAISSFEGLTGFIQFDPGSPIVNNYTLVQRNAEGLNSIVGGVTTTNETIIDSSLLTFRGGTVPISAIIPVQIHFGLSFGTGFTLAILIFLTLLTVSCFAYYIAFWRNTIIKRASPLFSVLILTGVILCILSQFFFDVRQTALTCAAKIWLLAIGIGLIFGNLFAKSYRIYKIFYNPRVTSVVIRDKDLLKITAAIFFVEVLLLSLYTFSSGVIEAVVITDSRQVLFQSIKCMVPSDFVQTTGTIVLVAFNSCLVIVTAVMAFLIRKVDAAFSEAIAISLTVYAYLFTIAAILPLYYTASDEAAALSQQFVLRTIGTVFTICVTISALFIPKIFLSWRLYRRERAARVKYVPEDRRIISLSSRNWTSEHGESSASKSR